MIKERNGCTTAFWCGGVFPKERLFDMSKIGFSSINQFCRSCEVYMCATTYTILDVMALSYMGVLTAAYYVSREDKPELSLLCYRTQGKALGMSSELADLRFMADIQNYGLKMIEQYSSEIQKYRKVG